MAIIHPAPVLIWDTVGGQPTYRISQDSRFNSGFKIQDSIIFISDRYNRAYIIATQMQLDAPTRVQQPSTHNRAQETKELIQEHIDNKYKIRSGPLNFSLSTKGFTA